jgi:hypothetical protein
MTNSEFDNNETKIIKTQDENGEIYSFELIDVIEFNEQEYGLLVPVEEEEKASEEGEEEEEEVVIMRLNKEDGNYVFETIEDDEEFNQVIAYIEAEEDLEEDDEE